MNLGLIGLLGLLQITPPQDTTRVRWMRLDPDTVYQPIAEEVAGFLRKHNMREDSSYNDPTDTLAYKRCWREAVIIREIGESMEFRYCESYFFPDSSRQDKHFFLEFTLTKPIYNTQTNSIDIGILGRPASCKVEKQGQIIDRRNGDDFSCKTFYLSSLIAAYGFLSAKYAKKEGK